MAAAAATTPAGTGAVAGASAGAGGGGAGERPMITSLLDTDLYKLTMLQAVRTHFPDAPVAFRFTNRSAASMPFTRTAFERIEAQIRTLAHLHLSADEADFLRQQCPYFTPDFLRWLQHDFRLRPDDQVQIRFVSSADASRDDQEWGQIEIETRGTWAETILYEVPLMAIISEVYFQTVDTNWDMTAQTTLAADKAYRLVSAGCVFSDFGTRRRRSLATHDAVLRGLLQGCERALAEGGSGKGKLLGTSNVFLAKKYGLTPIGTMAHEWFMGVGAALGYPHAAEQGGKGYNTSLRALQLWDQVYSPPPHGNFTPSSPAHDLTIALTDTFSTPVFWDELLHGDAPVPAEESQSRNAALQAARSAGVEIIRRWKGIRQDSGDSKEFARRAVQRYRSAGVDPSTKVIIYSDGLDVERCIELATFSKEIGIGAGFGIGTSLTNDFIRPASSPNPSADANAPVSPERSLPADQRQKSKALNMVIKLASINGAPTVKISDELTKNTGVKEEVVAVKQRFGLESASGVAS